MTDQKMHIHPTRTVPYDVAGNVIKDFFMYKKYLDGLRLGQYFCNTCNLTDSELFYSTNHAESMKIIYERYVK